MKVVLGVPWYFPYTIGGTEVYVATLTHELQKLAIECVITVPSLDCQAMTSTYRGVRVVRYRGPVRNSPSEGILASVNADIFREFLASERPDLYHQHDWSLNCGLTHLQAAKRLGIPTIITLHLPRLVCRMNTMMYQGQYQCDGEIIEQRCAQCFLTTRGVPRAVGTLVSKIPTGVAAKLARFAGAGRLFSGRPAARQFANGLHSVAESVDRILTVSQWLKDALLINGIPASKLESIRSGVDPDVVPSATTRTNTGSGVLRVGFLGRWNRAKGLHVLIAALQQLPSSIYTLRALATGIDAASVAYRRTIEKAVAGQPQFQLFANQPRSAVTEFFQNIDVLAVPSQWLENAPLVVLEANAWKVPVVGSNLGGIREMVRDQIDGLLVPHADIEAWKNALSQLASYPLLLQQLRENILPVRTMRDTARDMVNLYRIVSGENSLTAARSAM